MTHTPIEAEIEVAVFPNSGHHFYFVPFGDEDLEKIPALKLKCLSEKSGWSEGKTKEGPIRWVRYRFASEHRDGTGKLGILFAVETNLGTSERGWVYQPEEALSEEKAAAYSQNRQPSTPYAFPDLTYLPPQPVEVGLQIREDLLTPGDNTVTRLEINLTFKLKWLPAIADPIDVDLVVDFGNTRTVAVALENNQSAGGLLSNICRPISFIPRSVEFGDEPRPEYLPADYWSMIDSWFVLQEPLFAEMEPMGQSPRTTSMPVEIISFKAMESGWGLFKRENVRAIGRTLMMPQMFVHLSPSVLGPEAVNILSQIDVKKGGNYLLSSPKRYLWDDVSVGQMGITGRTDWTMNLNRWHDAPISVPKLAATILRFMDENGSDWTFGPANDGLAPNERIERATRPVPNPDKPRYPRADALTWAALEVIERSWQQISSTEWRRALGQEMVPRRLRSVVVTFPPGWTSQELQAYRSKWQKAIDIFTLGHLPDRHLTSRAEGQRGDRPVLSMEVDEAVASQLPIVFGEINRMGNYGENWIELVGRGHKADACTRIMNIDIGGGTTDIAIVEYKDELVGLGVALVSTILYRDSSTVAGDALVRLIIESVLLPAIGAGLNDDDKTRFETLLSQVHQADLEEWRCITRLVLIPVTRRWLGDYVKGIYDSGKEGHPPSPREMFCDEDKIRIFNILCQKAGIKADLLSYDTMLHYDKEKLAKCATEIFKDLFSSLSKVIEAFDCDLALASGKPSELPAVIELLHQDFPLLPQRILSAKGLSVGRWYPLSNDGVIHDAKTVTVAGAALFQAIKNGLIPGWQIVRRVSPHIPTRNYWGLMPLRGRTDFGRVFLTPEQDVAQCNIMIGDQIGRRLLSTTTRPEPVYKLRWKDTNRHIGGDVPVTAWLKVTLRRISPSAAEGILPKGESLEIAEVEGNYGNHPVSATDVELQLCTLDSDDYWMDQAIFHVRRQAVS